MIRIGTLRLVITNIKLGIVLRFRQKRPTNVGLGQTLGWGMGIGAI